MTATEPLNYRTYFKREFELRRARNASYSLRAFARDLGIAAPKLSQILGGTCGLSRQMAERVSSRLKLSPTESEFFIALVESEHSRSKLGKNQAKARVQEIQNTHFDELDLERFRIISDWYHFAILELTDLEDFKSSPHWISRRLGISETETTQAITRLLDHGLLRESGGKLSQTTSHLATPSGIPSRELRSHHLQILKKAEDALETVPVGERDFSANTFAIDSSKLTEAARWLQEFRRKFCNELQEGSHKDRVYCLSIQLFPLDQVSSTNKTPRGAKLK